jgi:release factor glutamine methyltransferase
MAEVVRPALGPLVRHLRGELERAGKPDAVLDARLIVEHYTGTTRTDAVLEPERPVMLPQYEAILAALERRLGGEPAYRIIGAREFYGLKLTLSRGTLEPRPDTEALVDLALPSVRRAVANTGACRILDLGTGTGAVALALIREEPHANALAADISDDALETASTNADINGLSAQFSARRSDWFETIPERFHVIVSNPPYIPSTEIASLEREVREHDPLAALDGGTDGLDAYRAIASGAASHLEADGAVFVEIGFGQEDDVTAIFKASGFDLIAQANDLAGRIRALAFAGHGCC